MPTDKPRVTFAISEEKLAALDSYRCNNKIKNQSQAILSLIDKGLSALESEREGKAITFSSTSGSVPWAISDEEQNHIKKYRSLDPYGKEAVGSILDIEHRRCTESAKHDKHPMIQAAARGGGISEIEKIFPDELPPDEDIPL